MIPAGTDLAPRNPGVEAWDDLDDDARALAARLQEAFAAFLEHTDAQIGRYLDELERLGRLDNTLVVLLSDNGASQEGGPFGVLHEMKYFNFIAERPAEAVERLDDIGGPDSHANYPWGWAQAGNTPFKWYKQNTHEGGVHVPLIVNWPARISDAGSLRDQFHHVNDLAPTIYAAIGVEPPEEYRGRTQLPVTGVAMTPTFDDPQRPSDKSVQYFEMMGHRAIHRDGWKAVTRHRPGTSFDEDRWELYDLRVDRSECHDLASEHPELLDELIELWWHEAEREGVLPLDDRTIELFGTRFRDHSPHRPDRHYTYLPPVTPMPAQVGPGLGGRSWDLWGTVERAAGQCGVIYATGTANSGLSLFVAPDGERGERLVFDYNCFGDHRVVESEVPLPVGPATLGVSFRRDAEGAGATATLVVDDEPVGSIHLPFAMFVISSTGASVGHDHGSAVSDRYDAPFAFEGTVERVDVQLGRARASEDHDAARADERSTMSQQ